MRRNVHLKPNQPPSLNGPKLSQIFHQKAYENWSCSANLKSIEISPNVKENLRNTFYDIITAKGFVKQTIHELYNYFKRKISKDDIGFDVIQEWTLETNGKSDQYINDLEFRSAFRCKMIKRFSDIEKDH